jgi:putative phosphoesterase
MQEGGTVSGPAGSMRSNDEKVYICSFKPTGMKRIGLLSDTHGYTDERWAELFAGVDEIWHAGDIGSVEVAEYLSSLKPFRAVYGNVDGLQIRQRYPEHLRFYCEEVEVWITHIGGYPGHYDHLVREMIQKDPPDLFITGHSHILKVMYDKKLDLLHINPGSAGYSGFHTKRTLVRFAIDGKDIRDLEVVELGPRAGNTL